MPKSNPAARSTSRLTSTTTSWPPARCRSALHCCSPPTTASTSARASGAQSPSTTSTAPRSRSAARSTTSTCATRPRRMPEGLSAAEVGKEIAEHKAHADAHGAEDGQSSWLSVIEAVLLSLVAVLAAYSGFAAAKWGTESSLMLAKASADRAEASRNDLEGIVTRTLDSASFNAWFSAFVAGNANDERLAEKRMRPGYLPAFKAWLATDPPPNPHPPP